MREREEGREMGRGEDKDGTERGEKGEIGETWCNGESELERGKGRWKERERSI